MLCLDGVVGGCFDCSYRGCLDCMGVDAPTTHAGTVSMVSVVDAPIAYAGADWLDIEEDYMGWGTFLMA
jgi:hypothetical protein